MPWTIGFFWAFLFGVGATIMLIVTLYFLYKALEDRRVSSTGYWIGFAFTTVAVFVFAYLSFFANTHFIVGANERALVIDYQQQVVGVYGSGIQAKPFWYSEVMTWPAEDRRALTIDLKSGSLSVSTKDHIAAWVTVNMYMNLRDLDIVRAYRSVNGNYDDFQRKYLFTQLANIARTTSSGFTTQQHDSNKSDWTNAFDQNALAFLSDPQMGYGVHIIPGNTTMSWDFVNPQDGAAYDTANRSRFLITQRENEQKALDIEANMAQTRARILQLTSTGVISSLNTVNTYMATLAPDQRQTALQYMQLMPSLEYLRLVGEQKPSTIFPPNGGPIPTYNVGSQTPAPAPAPTK